MSDGSGTDADAEGEKARLRDEMETQRQGLAPDQRSLRSARVLEEVVGSPEWAEADVVGFYVSVGAEVETRPTMEAALGSKTVAAPRTDPEAGTLAFAPVEALDDLEPGPLGVPEPPGGALEDGALDLVLVPGLAFDRAGNRLGRGGGYYDRFLSGVDVEAVGLAYRFQVVESVPVDEGDVPVDAVATEDGLLRPDPEG